MKLFTRILHPLNTRFLRWARRSTDIPVFGFDISDETIKYVKFRPEKHLDIEATGTITIPAGIITDGEIKKEDDLVALCREFRKSAPACIKRSFAIVSLPEEKSYVRLLEIPRVRRDDVGNAIRWELEGHIPLAVDDLAYDFDVLEPDSPADAIYHAVVVAFPKAIVESYASVLERSGIPPAALILESQALTRCIAADMQRNSSVIVTDIGRHRTSFAILADGAMLFTNTIQTGGLHMERAIATALNVSAEEAVVIKKTIGFHRRKFDGRLHAALLPFLTAIGDELRRLMDFYAAHAARRANAPPRITGILLAGGDANLYGLDTYLASSLKVPISGINPFASSMDRFRFGIPPLPQRTALAFTVAIGLALHGISPE
ncbi:MAG: type IV pilus assembly protein PilM [Patescibacteria group bacterium]